MGEKLKSDAVVLISGVSSGIGLEIAKKLSQTSYRVVATAREKSLSRLSELGLRESEKFLIRKLDVTDNDQRHRLIDEISAQWGGVDVLINNAGISFRAVVEHMSDEEEITQLNTNYLAPMALTRLVLPHMRDTGHGRIINISSVSGMMAMPTMSSYTASKFALEGASEALWYELKPWDIKVSLIQPGFVHSNSFKNVYYSKRSAACEIDRDIYCEYYAAMAPFVERLMKLSRTTAVDVADKVIRVLEMKDPPLRVPATIDAQIFFWLRRMLPRNFYHWFLYRSLPVSKNWVIKSER